MRVARRQFLSFVATMSAAIVIEETMSGTADATAIGSYKKAMTTLFWVGEPANAADDYISNEASYWDKNWQGSYGGIDHPHQRQGYWPAAFRPKENPFYVALPFGEFTESNKLKRKARDIPWFRAGVSPLLKNRWVEIRRKGRSCFAQWQDVGPCGENDFSFVFGNAAKPRNTFDARAGLDISPAVWHFLGMQDNEPTAWRLVEASAVPPGPWAEIITTSRNNR